VCVCVCVRACVRGGRSRLGHSPLPPSPINNADFDEFTAVRLEDVDVIATLGMGGFGRVELVSLSLSLSLTHTHTHTHTHFSIATVTWLHNCAYSIESIHR